MTDVMVSVRLPKSLLDELKQVARKEHYLDISEAIRSILRHKWMQYEDPYAYELKQLRKSIEQELKSKIARETQHRLTEELKKIRQRIRDEL